MKNVNLKWVGGVVTAAAGFFGVADALPADFGDQVATTLNNILQLIGFALAAWQSRTK